jgi:hypothetical protein
MNRLLDTIANEAEPVVQDAARDRLPTSLAAVAPATRASWSPRPPMQRQRLLRVLANSAYTGSLRDIQRQQRRIFSRAHEYQTLAVREQGSAQLLPMFEQVADDVARNFEREEQVLSLLDPTTLTRLRVLHRRVMGDLRASLAQWRVSATAAATSKPDPAHLLDALLVYYFVDDIFVDL